MRKTTTPTFTEWLDSYPTASTRACYHSAARSYLQIIYGSESAPPEELAKSYIQQTKSGKRDCIADLFKFVSAIRERPPLTIHLYTTAVRQFLLYCCNIDLTTKERRMLRLRIAGQVGWPWSRRSTPAANGFSSMVRGFLRPHRDCQANETVDLRNTVSRV